MMVSLASILLPGEYYSLSRAQAAGASAGATQTPAKLDSRIDPKAQELLDRAIQALGGPAFLRFKSMTTSGRVFAIADGITAGLATFESIVEFPEKRRFAYGKNPPVILINDGDHAWELDRYGLTRQSPEQTRRWKLTTRYGLENLLRIRVRDAGVLIQDGGVDFVDNAPTRVVNIITRDEGEVRLFLNKQNFLPVRIAYKVRSPQSGEWDEYADVYGDYQQAQGVMTPMHIARFLNDERVGETFRNKVRYDENYPSETFQAVR